MVFHGEDECIYTVCHTLRILTTYLEASLASAAGWIDVDLAVNQEECDDVVRGAAPLMASLYAASAHFL